MTHKTASFVRNELIPESPPPVSETGAVKWMRENLFSSPLNIIMTIASLWAVYTLFNSVAPWFLNGVWSGNSVRDCYEILDGATGACFAVLKERWPQLIYGFKYPPSEFWRPNFAAVLLNLCRQLFFWLH